MTVSSGTYVRSIVHDIGIALASAAHVVELVRTRQGQFALDPADVRRVEGEDSTEALTSVVSWDILEKGIQELRSDVKQENGDAVGGSSELSAWEKAIVDILK